MGGPEDLPRDSKVRFAQAPVKRAVAWIAMQHRNLRAMPHSTASAPIGVSGAVAILQQGDQELPRQTQFLSQFRGSKLRSARRGGAQTVYNALSVLARIVPVLLDLHDVALPLQKAEDRSEIAA